MKLDEVLAIRNKQPSNLEEIFDHCKKLDEVISDKQLSNLEEIFDHVIKLDEVMIIRDKQL